MIINNIQPTLHESWDRTDFSTPKLLLATETQATLAWESGRQLNLQLDS